MDAKALYEQMHQTFHQFKAKNDEAIDEVKKYGSSLQETTNIVDGLNDRISELETKLARPALVGNASASGASMEVKIGRAHV